MNTIAFEMGLTQTYLFRRLLSDHLVEEVPSRASMHKLYRRSVKSHATKHSLAFNNKVIEHLIVLVREQNVIPDRRRKDPIRQSTTVPRTVTYITYQGF